ncbi:MAG: 1-deoxy-D-xylulose-5-phosphate reductoisomerase [Nitrospirota bacterium]|nr:1-deoxy-D-xylulose-5-phosphate reductoisomerase [Nitrospirota bacterium]MDX2419838.1 1-deoxy-D-xylulose-5-phosphate reductoisomerase [Nitrospirota bacterium]
MKRIVILGSTGSIGSSTLDVVSRFPDRFQIVGLAAGSNDQILEDQIRTFQPKVVALSCPDAAKRLRARVGNVQVEVLDGEPGLCEVARFPQCDLVISAIVGGAGLKPTLSAIQAGRQVALANKEPMVMAGQLMQQEAHKHGVTIFPIDSEHSAIFQSMEGHRKVDIRRVVLTASGGPFWDWPATDFEDITPEQALKHPNWKMGAKITTDSATLMNKGLEVIEARWLFDLPASQIDVVIHRESIIHSLVEYCDGSVISQLGHPDMRTPISYAMNYPERVPLHPPLLDLGKIGKLTFFPPDTEKFPCLQLAYNALAGGAGLPATLNAANEVAVHAFLNNQIAFLDIPKVIEETMAAYCPSPLSTIEEVLDVDQWARRTAEEIMKTCVAPV